MKLVHYIRETARVTAATQRREAEPYRDSIVHEIVDGAGGRKFDDALQLLRRGSGLLVYSAAIIGRGPVQRHERLKAVINKGAVVVTCDAIMELGRKSVHNRTPDDVRERAWKYWSNHSLTNKQVEELSGVNYITMRGWWHDKHPRPPRKPGRPRKK